MNCIGCKNCIGCVGLNNKEYYAFNEPISPEEFQTLIMQLQTPEGKNELLYKSKMLRNSIPILFAEVL